jgi:NAD(P)-dependent dehydrogenase (short-subunit alcohol dehydrogenase family)
MISSGAAVLGNKGWGAYALSKAALNMLAKLYAHEPPDTHITALAPGIIDSAMMDYLCDEADADAFPALKRLRDARGSERMPRPDTAAAWVLDVLPRLAERASRSFVDTREVLEPEVYAALFRPRLRQVKPRRRILRGERRAGVAQILRFAPTRIPAMPSASICSVYTQRM